MEVGDDEWKERARDYNQRQRLLRGQCDECGALYPEEHTARREGVIEGRAQAEAELQSRIDAAIAREREAAVYDFAAWLTTRKERLVLSSSDDAAPAAKAVQAYLRARSAKGE